MEDKTQKYWQIQQSIHENIKFADTKAGSIMALNLALIATTNALILSVSDRYSFLFILGCLSIIVLVISIGCTVKVIYPRGDNSTAPNEASLCDLNKIAKSSFDEYRKNVKKSSDKQLLDDIILFIYDRSLNNRTKYKWLKREINFGIVGWILTFVTLGCKVLS